MERNEARDRILREAIGISDPQIELVGRILDLEKDKKRISSVEIHHGTVGYRGLSAAVYLLRDFKNIEDFKEYLAAKNLPTNSTLKSDSYYFLQSSGVRAEFSVPFAVRNKR